MNPTHFTLATAQHYLDLDYEAAIASFEKAKAAGSSLGEVDSEIAEVYMTQGQMERAIAMLETAQKVGLGANRSSARTWLARCYMAVGQYDNAVSTSQIAVDAAGQGLLLGSALETHATACHFAGNPCSKTALQQLVALQGVNSPRLLPIRALLGEGDAVRTQLKNIDKESAPTVSHFVLTYLWLGDIDAAMDWLDRAVDNREYFLLRWLRRWSEFEPLRRHPRYAAIEEKLRRIENNGVIGRE